MARSIIAVDIGFVATGLAAFDFKHGEWVPTTVTCVEVGNERLERLVANNDVWRIQAMARGIDQFIGQHQGELVVELPNGAARGARAQRCMGISTAIIAVLAGQRGRKATYVTPKQTREAACPGQRTVTKKQVVAVVRSVWPWIIDSQKRRPQREAVADAVATFWAGLPLGVGAPDIEKAGRNS